MTLSTVSLTITEQDAGEGAASGQVAIAPTSAVVVAGQTVVSAIPVQRTLSGGSITVTLVACDNAGTTPAAGYWAYQITLPGGQPQLYLVNFANGASQRLDNLTPVQAQTVYTAVAASAGTVTGVSVASANGFAGSVATPSTTPAITLQATVAGLLKGNGTAISAAAAGTDYLAPTGNGSQLTGLTESQISGLASDLAALSAGIAARAQLAGATFTGYLAPKAVTLTDGSSVLIDTSQGNVFDWPLGGASHTLAAPSNPVDGEVIVIRIAYSGSFTPLFNAIFDFNGSPPAWTAASGKEDEAAFRYRSASSRWRYQGSMLGFIS